uniref:39S ribosomal protein L50, mitochondrial n=1 Tax=Caenorhabditis tropicalis TaxID=1561998 RepID=A0A1I7TZ45_9PELO
MSGAAGYHKSWSVIQRAVDNLMTETTVPVPLSTMKNREPRHLPKRRIFVSLYRDVHLNNLILKTQKFQLEYEATSPFTRQTIIDYPTERQKPRKERHYEFWPFFEQLPELDEEEQIAPENIKEEEVHDTLGFASDNSVELAEECKENSTFLPAPLSDDITKEIADLFAAPVKSAKIVSHGFMEKYMKKGPFARIF